MKNKCLKRSKISEKKYRHWPSVNRLLMDLWLRIAAHCEASSPLLEEIDESHFEPKQIRGKKSRGAGKKIVIFGILKRGSKIYTQVVAGATRIALRQVLEAKIDSASTVYSDGWKAYDGLIDWGYQKHYRINHGNSVIT